MRLIWLVSLLGGCSASLTALVDSSGDKSSGQTDVSSGVDTGTPSGDDDDDDDTTEALSPPVDTVDTVDTVGAVDTGTSGSTPTPGWVCPDDTITGPGLFSGTTAGQGDDDSGACGGAGAADLHLSFTAPSTGRYLFDLAGTSFDSVLYVLDGCGGAQIDCDDVAGSEQLLVPLISGQQAVVVIDGANAASVGAFDLTATAIPATEGACANGADDDLDGDVDCADADCAGTSFCTENCSNGADDDGDGFTDCYDADCVGAPACTEACGNGTDDDVDGFIDCYDADCVGTAVCTEACGNGTDDDVDGFIDCYDADCVGTAACTESCSNGTDDDTDGLVDCLDSDCSTAAACVAPCADATFLPPLPDVIVGDTTLAIGDYTPSCALSNAPDFEFDFVAPTSGVYTFDTVGSAIDTVLYALDGCAGTELACNDDTTGLQSEISLFMTVGERVIIVVDGFANNSGSVTVTAN